MSGKMVRRPVVNCICSISSRACGRTSRRDEAGREQRLRFGGEGDAAGDLGGVERLDAERIAGEREVRRDALVDGDGVHAA